MVLIDSEIQKAHKIIQAINNITISNKIFGCTAPEIKRIHGKNDKNEDILKIVNMGQQELLGLIKETYIQTYGYTGTRDYIRKVKNALRNTTETTFKQLMPKLTVGEKYKITLKETLVAELGFKTRIFKCEKQYGHMWLMQGENWKLCITDRDLLDGSYKVKIYD